MYRILLFVCVVFFSCSEKQESKASFYYWKTTFKLRDPEKSALKDLHTSELYIRFFDVDKQNDSIAPLGVLSGLNAVPDSIRTIPVVFITNRTFGSISEKETAQLAGQVYGKITTMLSGAGKSCSEIQIDCDWTEKTKEEYFLFLKKLKAIAPEKTLSTTIRLHQAKYPLRSGVPPVDKGMLMFYNMGDSHKMSGRNSIYNKEDAEKYVGYVSSYPLPLDIALPIFSWQLQFRNEKLSGIIPKDDCPDTDTTPQIAKTADPRVFEIKSSFLHKGRYFMESDLLKTERLTKDELIEAATLLAGQKNRKSPRRIVFFDLDEYNLKTVEHETIEEVLDILK
ncbi:MAG: hypothetical protein K0S33_233 [Bacteroidetes bacterium]|jgi:hypothetical protein|nr:hypothetical protein [Bacteroidota bacterium]